MWQRESHQGENPFRIVQKGKRGNRAREEKSPFDKVFSIIGKYLGALVLLYLIYEEIPHLENEIYSFVPPGWFLRGTSRGVTIYFRFCSFGRAPEQRPWP